MLSIPKASQVSCQHWSRLFCFAAGFRRPLFAVLEQIFGFIVEMDGKAGLEEALPNAVRDEILLAGLLAPLTFTNLRAPLREIISVTDASEQGGTAGEATRFVTATNNIEEKKGSSLRMNALEEERIPLCSILCTKCNTAGEQKKGPLHPWVSRVVLLGTELPRAPPQLLARGPRQDQGGHR